MSLVRRILLPALLAAAVAVPAPASAGPVRPAGITSVTLEGHGYGHANGMGQYGALGYAVDHGWNWRRIVDHFYSNTTAGTVRNMDITVRLTANDGANMIVRSDSPFTVAGIRLAAGQAVQVQRTGTSSFVVTRAPAGAGSCGGPWQSAVTVNDTVVEVRPSSPPPNSSTDLSRLLTLCRPGEQRWYRGALRLVSVDGTSRTVNRLPVESYVQGVVPREVIASWAGLGGGRGSHALAAQAVAARSYALAENRYSYAKTCDSTSCQVYGGVAVRYGTGSVSVIEYESTSQATATTAGAVRRTASGAIARTEFSTSSGGYTMPLTEGSAFPAVPDEGDDTSYNPYHSWTVTISASTIEAHWPAVGDLTGVSVTKRNGFGEWGGRAREIVLQGTGGNVTLTCGGWSSCSFRSLLALKSDWFRVVSTS